MDKITDKFKLPKGTEKTAEGLWIRLHQSYVETKALLIIIGGIDRVTDCQLWRFHIKDSRGRVRLKKGAVCCNPLFEGHPYRYFLLYNKHFWQKGAFYGTFWAHIGYGCPCELAGICLILFVGSKLANLSSENRDKGIIFPCPICGVYPSGDCLKN